MADGIKLLLEGFRKPFLPRETTKIRAFQTNMFGP